MTTTTWDDGPLPLQYERGLPSEVHFWRYGKDVYILRDTDNNLIPTWCVWKPGVAIKDVGVEHITAEQARG